MKNKHKADNYRILQDLLRNKALKNGVKLIAPETIFLLKDNNYKATLINKDSITIREMWTKP